MEEKKERKTKKEKRKRQMKEKRKCTANQVIISFQKIRKHGCSMKNKNMKLMKLHQVSVIQKNNTIMKY